MVFSELTLDDELTVHSDLLKDPFGIYSDFVRKIYFSISNLIHINMGGGLELKKDLISRIKGKQIIS